MMVAALMSPCWPRPALIRALPKRRCAESSSLNGIPLRTRGMKCQSNRCSSSNANAAFARWSADNELINASAAVLINDAECEPLPVGASENFIATAGDSNKETPAIPRVDCKNTRRASVLLSFDGLVIRHPSPGTKQSQSRLLYSLVGVFVNLSALRG